MVTNQSPKLKESVRFTPPVLMVYNPYTNPVDDYLETELYELEDELSEAISRHHEDFEKIRAILDDIEATGFEYRKLKSIRNIVG